MLAFGKASFEQKLILLASLAPVIGPAAVGFGLKRRINPRAVTPHKVRNLMLACRESVSRAVEVRSLPYVLNIDTINACNLACPFCPTGTKQLHRKKSRLGFDEVRRIIDLTASHVLAVRFYNWGEPFINPEIFEMIRYAGERGLHTSVSSNLSIKGEGLAERILDSGLDNLHVSVDGLEQATLEPYRRKADAVRVYDNIREIVAQRRRRGSASPRIELVFLVFRHNEHEVPRLAAAARELGVDAFTPSPAFIYHDSFVPRDPRFAPLRSIFRHSCHYLYSELTIEADGGISPCCTNSDSRWDVGSIADLGNAEELRAFWNSPTYRAMRAFNAGQPKTGDDTGAPATLCEHCNYIGEPLQTCGTVSPLPPAMNANGESFAHGLDGPPLVAQLDAAALGGPSMPRRSG